MLLHLAALQWLGNTAVSEQRHDRAAARVSVQFRDSPDLTEAPVPHRAVATPRARVHPTPRAGSLSPVAPPEAADTTPADATPVTAPAPVEAQETDAPPVTPSVAVQASTAATPGIVVNPPPSAHLEMQLIRTEPQRNPVYGKGAIHWERQDERYNLRIEAGLDLLLTTVNLYQLSSNGTIVPAGIVPDTMTEARRNRAATATHFNWQEKSVSFSSSNKAQDLNEGAQDKASILLQLAGIGRADAQQFTPGREFAFQVAEERDAHVFTFVVVGEEEIETRLGKLPVWRVVRPPRPGYYNSQLELWLAPGLYWLPVQIRNTETNGAITTQIMTNFTSNTER